MIGSNVLEVGIGLILVYVAFSLLCSALSEWIARLLALRATTLRSGISDLLRNGDTSKLAASFHTAPLIEALKPSKAPLLRRRDETARYPSYISASAFALTVMHLTMDVSAPTPQTPNGSAVLLKASDSVLVTPTLQQLLQDVEGDAQAVRERLENWFNDAMERVSGWYKRRNQTIIFCIAAIVAVSFNVDTVRVTKDLFTDAASREALVRQADVLVDQHRHESADSLSANVAAMLKGVHGVGIPLGWDNECNPLSWRSGHGCVASGMNALGILLTVVALSMGAPFWFDVLNKLVNLRQTGDPPNVGNPT